MGQHYLSKNLIQYCRWGSRKQCTGKNPVQCCLNFHCTGKILCDIAQEASDNIAQEKIFFNDALKYSRVNIAQVNTLYDVALEAPDKNAQKKYCSMMS